ncbi:carbamoyl phosphate synthase small subunit [Dehalococcoides mccartyi]|jgi:carbamoyl-phosphate synthase small subunit|uniref:glutamine-hydrolyzing carbamoyl-phosphate synthase small subunit n=1 Tax=Dehalococcoides mccartyi TaxID=61435 RepID=UPI0004E02D77|nr:glutamine-hydrolyzing carbamoyl-phosphate synthase small subunit [Dehalococcoides mccartyi]AII58156.1 carbamoyl phosphate synthase small subunit [Dehalococcoides mccartyi CG1]APH12744.1 carbamoyl phosphate synthase small subunit [Dehalococcoides mccartyi]
MTNTAYLVLEDGTVFSGKSFGAETEAIGEVVFNTSMNGYQEMLTDPSYTGQIIIPTYPLIGNYGVNPFDNESACIRATAFGVHEECLLPNHYQNNQTIHSFLEESGIPGISGIDTRAITRKLRSAGVMRGMITTTKTPEEAFKTIRSAPDYGQIDFVRKISTPAAYEWQKEKPSFAGFHIAVLDCGLKYSILNQLKSHGCKVSVLPCTASPQDIDALNPDGVLLSPGPGNPELLDYLVNTVRYACEKYPVMGICLGNQLIGKVFGAKTFKLKFGHRGGNHPVKDLTSGRVYITSQNHGYSLDPATLKEGLEVSHINLNDGTVEGLRHRELPVFSIQYHSEASPGPMDSTYLFKQFVETIKQTKK